MTKIKSFLKVAWIHQHLKFRPFLTCVLLKMPGNYNFSLFHLVKISPKLGNWTDCDQNLTSSESVPNSSACPILVHSSYPYYGKCPGPTNLTRSTIFGLSDLICWKVIWCFIPQGERFTWISWNSSGSPWRNRLKKCDGWTDRQTEKHLDKGICRAACRRW